MDDFPSTRDGVHAVPVWGLINGITFGSFLSTPADIPPQVVDHLHNPPRVLHPDTSKDIKRLFDFRKGPILYNPTEHWLGWCSPSELDLAPFAEGVEDPIGFAFARDSGSVNVRPEYVDIPGGNSEASDDDRTLRAFAGYWIVRRWVDRASWTANKLYFICKFVATRSRWYCENGQPERVGSLPPEPSMNDLMHMHDTIEAAYQAIDDVKAYIISCLGFLVWFESVADLFQYGLSEENEEFVRSLRLKDRRKIGLIYFMQRDLHDSNFLHLIYNEVPIHFAWTEDMASQDRFLRLNPKLWSEAAAKINDNPLIYVDFSDIPSRVAWQAQWDESDWFFQYARAGRMGQQLKTFKKGSRHGLVDFTPFGLRLLTDANEIRAVSERFKCFEKRSLNGPANAPSTYIYFRQNPIHLDEPSLARQQPEMHEHPLSTFAEEYTENPEIERAVFFENTVTIRERVKNILAPRADRYFSSYSGSLDPTRPPASEPSLIRRLLPAEDEPPAKKTRSMGSSVTLETQFGDQPLSRTSLLNRMGIVTRRVENDLAVQDNLQERASRVYTSDWIHRMSEGLPVEEPPPSTNSDRLSDVWSAASRRVSFPLRLGRHQITPLGEHLRAEVIDERVTGTSNEVVIRSPSPILSEGEALRRILTFASERGILEVEAVYPPLVNVTWGEDWITNARLHFSDERSHLRFKVLAVRNRHIGRIEGILEQAIRHGIPFELYTKRSDARKFNDLPIPSLERNTLAAIYSPGYVDEPLEWNQNGASATYTVYLAKLSVLLSRPQALAFIRMGGVLRYVYGLYCSEGVNHFAAGLSLQVSHFDKGDTKTFDDDPNEFYTTDTVSHSEIGLLIGRIPGKDPETDLSLWPPPEILEHSTWVMRGYLSAKAFQLLESVKKEIFGSPPNIRWRTRGHWNKFFKKVTYNSAQAEDKNFKGVVPKPKDFEELQILFDFAFPSDWRNQEISEIVLPEVFTPAV
ncbi:hypothetical protein R3P38DRAFT_3239324 [Favolaschia claudopus]|uniref:Uncharacterized protein n=1 Tax=Favolaschia claudopus TaxID=2862362 RepID=A0AAV9Z8M3_9AGAR